MKIFEGRTGMKLFTQYKRKNPDAILGDKITVIQTYSSFDKDEIDKLEQYFKQSIGDGLVAELKGEKNE